MERHEGAARLEAVRFEAPRWPSRFVGRTAEIERIRSLLQRPDCRLLTLVGPGGSGKTRLAVEAAATFANDTPAVFVPLEPFDDVEAALARWLDLRAERREDRRQRILSAIGDRRLFLVLDNMDRLTGQAPFLEEIIDACPNVRLLVTSRSVLGSGHEWLLPVGGLSYPKEAGAAKARDFDAVRLLVERAEQLAGRPVHFDEVEQAARICRQVDGVPLALELAAGWSSTLSLQEIADEIERDSSILTARSRTVPDRHASIRTVFEHSWQLLEERERSAFARLGVFVDGFSREAAAFVAGAGVLDLASLLDKSLLQRESGGRYRLHPLMLEFAAEHLREEPAAEERVRDLHSAFYLGLLQDRRPDLDGFHQAEAIRGLLVEWGNVRQAWRRALDKRRAAEVAAALYPIHMVLGLMGRYEEALEFANAVFDAGDEEHLLRYNALVIRGWMNLRAGNLDVAEEAAREANAILEARGTGPPRGLNMEPLCTLGVVALARGDYAAAEEFGLRAVRRSDESGEPAQGAIARYVLENAYFEQGRLEEATRVAREAFRLSRSAGDDWFLAYLHHDLGRQAQAAGDLETAEAHFEEGLRIRSSFGDIGGVALAQEYLAGIASARGDIVQAEQRLAQSLQLYGRAGDRGGMARSLLALGRAAHDRPLEAAGRFAQALEQAGEAALAPLVLEVLVEVARLGLVAGGRTAALHLLCLALADGRAGLDTQRAAKRAVEEGGYRAAEFAASERWAASASLDDVARAVAGALRRPDARQVPGLEMGAGTAGKLGPREAQILGLICRGWSNQRIAAELGLKVGTVKWHTAQLFGKLGVNNRAEAIARARELGIHV